MKIFSKAKKIFVLGLMLLIMLPISTAYASEKVDVDKKASINIKHINKDRPIINTKFTLYRVGEISEDVQFKLSEKFKNYSIDFDSIKEQSKWDEVAHTLATYVQADKIASDVEGTTKENGSVSFTNLKTGLYLVVGDTGFIGNSSVKTSPFIVALPSKDKNTGSFIYDLDITTKNDEITRDKIDFKVEKIWLNDENIKDKPASIEVDLYRDSKVYDTVTLNESNNWKYVWENLDSKYNWNIIEKIIPNNYTVSYEKYSTSVKIKNTYKKPSLAKPPTSILPQTGSPWRIAQGFALVGIVLIGAGLIIKKRSGQKDKKDL